MIEHERRGALTPQLARTVGSKTGLSRNLYYELPIRDDPNDGVVLAGESPDFGELLDLPDPGSMRTRGKGNAVPQAAATYLGEVVERYVVLASNPDVVVARYDDLADDYVMVDAKWLRRYSETELRRADECGLAFDPFREDDRRSWVAGVDLLSGEPSYLPSELVSWTIARRGDNPICFPTTNGLACHETTPRALLSSIYECLERHAFIESWFARKTPTRLLTDEFETENEYTKYHLFEYDADIDIDVPLVGCLCRNREREAPYACLCGGAANTYRSAIRDTLGEATQLWNWLSRVEPGKQPDPRSITDLTDNLYYYLDPENAAPMDEFLEGGAKRVTLEESSRRFDDPERELEFLLEELRSIDVTPIAFDITTPEIEANGLVVTKVVIPELLSLTPPSFPTDEHPRLAGRIETTEPHPYP